jgi:ribosomal protein S18 acetylase RimI-like enzyme
MRRERSLATSSTRLTNAGAQVFYEKLGFRKKGVIPRYYWTEDAYIMVR